MAEKELSALVISDLQIPFEHRDALAFIQHLDQTFFPDGVRRVICVGDEVDQHTLGRWPANPSGRSGSDELEEAKHRLKDWFKAFPEVLVCMSNHTYRAWKKAFHAGIPAQFLRDVAEVYEAPPGWKWADRWLLDGLLFEHGEHVSGKNAALLAAEQNHMSTVIGHQHTFGGVIYSASYSNQIWGMNVGCLIDIEQYAFDYGKALRKKPTLGSGVIVNGIPFFIPMLLDRNKRWIGRIL